MPRLSAEIADRIDVVAERADAPPLAPCGQPAHPVIDLAHLERMTQGETSLQREVLELFVLQADILLARMQGETPRAIGALAHTLCGSARGIGAWSVAEAAEAVQRSAQEAGDVAGAVERLTAAVAEAHAAVGEILRAGS